MNLERYETLLNDTATVFEFISEGKIGSINKMIEYSPTNVATIYNLGFGDRNEITGELDDKVVTDNGDTQKVLATVAATVYVFTNHNPNIWIYATGSSISRNRLYRMGITKFLSEIETDFEIYGLENKVWKPFEVGKNYTAFLVKRKPNKI